LSFSWSESAGTKLALARGKMFVIGVDQRFVLLCEKQSLVVVGIGAGGEERF
jgi:hypothetical protein